MNLKKSRFRQVVVEIANTNIKTAEAYDIAYRLEELVNSYYAEAGKEDLFNRIARFHIEFERIRLP
ncbi:MAG: hypothetical protein WDW19_04055 [Neisseriaceae bacterium]